MFSGMSIRRKILLIVGAGLVGLLTVTAAALGTLRSQMFADRQVQTRQLVEVAVAVSVCAALSSTPHAARKALPPRVTVPAPKAFSTPRRDMMSPKYGLLDSLVHSPAQALPHL